MNRDRILRVLQRPVSGESLGKCDCVLTVKDVKASALCLSCDEDNTDESLLLQAKCQDVRSVLSEVLEK